MTSQFLVTNSSPHVAYRVAGACPFHLAQSGHISLEDVHLLHQGGESRLCGFTHLLINAFGLGENRNTSKTCCWTGFRKVFLQELSDSHKFHPL